MISPSFTLNSVLKRTNNFPSVSPGVSSYVSLFAVFYQLYLWITSNDDGPAYIHPATDSSKKEKHGDGGRALKKKEPQIHDLEAQKAQAKDKKE